MPPVSPSLPIPIQASQNPFHRLLCRQHHHPRWQLGFDRQGLLAAVAEAGSCSLPIEALCFPDAISSTPASPSAIGAEPSSRRWPRPRAVLADRSEARLAPSPGQLFAVGVPEAPAGLQAEGIDPRQQAPGRLLGRNAGKVHHAGGHHAGMQDRHGDALRSQVHR